MTSEQKLISIVGRPNVGKSTLFNRLVGRRMALVHPMPGMTRDCKEAQGFLYDLSFRLYDTAGLADPKETTLSDLMRQKTLEAVKKSQVVLFLIDAKAGLTPYDRELAQTLRVSKVPVIVVANKCENIKNETAAIAETVQLGLGETICISAEHGQGLGDLYDALTAYIEPGEEKKKSKKDKNEDIQEDLEESDEQAVKRPMKLAIVGRPNVGKSTLINALLKEERLLVADMPGVTRDSVTVSWSYNDKAIDLVDTAGLRKKARIDDSAEKLATMDTFRAIQYADVVVLVLDATQNFDKQDLIIASHVIKEGRALIIALNKWDKVYKKPEVQKEFERVLSIQLTQVKGIKWISTCALRSKNLDTLMESVLEVYETWNKRISTAKLNKWLEHATVRHPPPAVEGRRLRLKYMTQIKSRPPTFALFCTHQSQLPESYVRYLSNSLT